ncbi:B-cell lymphoma 3 protein homolog isoform 2-T2 [Pholidichthys leucotaenia]
MPRIMTMNGDYPSVPAAPLDLRTTNSRSRDAKATSGAPARQASIGTDCMENHCPTIRCTPSSEASVTRKRPADTSSSKLPFRKRPIPTEPETQRRSPAAPEAEDRLSPAGNNDSGGLGENMVGVAPISPRHTEEGARSPDGYSILFLPSYNYELSYSLIHPTDIAMATRQDEDGDTALHIAVVQGKMDIVCKLIRLLLWAGRSLDIYNNLRQTPLHLAVITKQASMVEVLLRGGADPAALDRNGQTALHLCCEYDQRDCLFLLLSPSSPSTCLEIRNYEGLSPLHLAVLQCRKNLAQMLLDAGADINAMDIKSGQTPLMHAVESSNTDMVHFLIENGCDVNTQSYSGNTALHSACGRGQVDIVRLLLKSGADSSLKNYHNDTPVMVAKNKKIADVLRGRGSKQTRVQDQHGVCISPNESILIESGSLSPNNSRGCSPSTTPHSLHHSAPHSPKTHARLDDRPATDCT